MKTETSRLALWWMALVVSSGLFALRLLHKSYFDPSKSFMIYIAPLFFIGGILVAYGGVRQAKTFRERLFQLQYCTAIFVCVNLQGIGLSYEGVLGLIITLLATVLLLFVCFAGPKKLKKDSERDGA